jgi:hypothetical protein
MNRSANYVVSSLVRMGYMAGYLALRYAIAGKRERGWWVISMLDR